MKNTLLLTCVLLMSFGLVGQTRLINDAGGNTWNQNWKVNGVPPGTGLTIFGSSNEYVHFINAQSELEVTYYYPTTQGPTNSIIEAFRAAPSGFSNLLVKTLFDKSNDPNLIIDLVGYSNGLQVTLHQNISSNTLYSIDNSTDSVGLKFHTNVPLFPQQNGFKLLRFQIYGNTETTSGFHEIITYDGYGGYLTQESNGWFGSNNWKLNDTLITGGSQAIGGYNNEIISFSNTQDRKLEVYYTTFSFSTPSVINISKDIPNGYKNKYIEVTFGESNDVSLSLDIVRNYPNGSDTIFQVSSGYLKSLYDSTVSIELLFHTYVYQGTSREFKLINFQLFGDTITTTNIQENIANNFSVYSYNKNLVVKTTALENYSIRIYNISGQEVLVKNAQGNQDIPLNLATGVYIVNVSNSKESYNQKVVVQ